MNTTENFIDVRNNKEAQQLNLEKRIEKNAERNKTTLTQIANDGAGLNDFILNLGKTSLIEFTANGIVKMVIKQDEPKAFTVHPHAIVSVGEKLGINSTFIKDLANSDKEWKRQLISQNLNTFVANTDRNRVLVREVNGEIRGFLSDSYKRYNSLELYRSFISGSEANGMEIIDTAYNGLQGFMESVYPSVFPVNTQKNGMQYWGFGARMKNSDFGVSAYEFSAFLFLTTCYNGMTTSSIIREVHAGAVLPTDLQLAKDTMDHHTKYLTGVTRDAINSVLSPGSVEKKIAEIQNASYQDVDMGKEFKQLTKSNKMNKAEVETLQKIVTNNKPEDGVAGENTLLKLSLAIGRVGVKSTNPIRKRELDELAYSLMTRNN